MNEAASTYTRTPNVTNPSHRRALSDPASPMPALPLSEPMLTSGMTPLSVAAKMPYAKRTAVDAAYLHLTT